MNSRVGRTPADGHRFDAVVIGQSLPVLTAALHLAETDLRVAVVAGPVVGVTDGDQPAAYLPTGPELDHEQGVASLLSRIATPIPGTERRGDSTEVRAQQLMPPMLQNTEGAWLKQSEPEVFGIPAVPLSVETLALLGTGAALRAYLDRITPVLTIGKVRDFALLARKRLGRAALDRLVRPQLLDRFGTDEVEVAIAAPGLNEALTRTGALTAAVLAYSERHVARETAVEPAGGWGDLAAQLRARLENYAVTFVDGTVVGVERAEDGWVIGLAEDAATVLRAEALIVDADATQTDGLQIQGHFIGALRPTQWRIHASVGIEGDAEVDRAVESGAVAALRVVDGWSIRTERDSAGAWMAHLSSLGQHVADGAAGQRRSADAEVLAGAHAALAQTGLQANAAWRTRVAAAPFVSVSAREEASSRLSAQRHEEPDLLWLGQSLHGDSLSAALADTDSAAIALRRRLLGLGAE